MAQGAPPPGAAPPAPPPAAEAFFGDRLPLAVEYAALLAGPGVLRGLLGPREVPRIWDRHVLNCAAVAPGIAAGARVADLGAGAGLPGVVVAIARPDVHVTLIEPLLRRSSFLAETLTALRLANASVLRCRAEDHPPPAGYDIVLARAVAPLDRLVAWALPLLRPGGTLLALKGESASKELEEAADALGAVGAARWSVQQCSIPGIEQTTTVIEVIAGRVPRETVRRRAGRSARG